MKKHIITLLICGNVLSGCASGINSLQKHEMEVYKEKGLAVHEKDPGTGVALGFLPGGGSFYTRNYGLGVLNLLLWPLSILWDPISGADGSESINYNATTLHVRSAKNKEMEALEERLSLSTISTKQYMQEKARIERKYSPSL